MLRLAEVTRFDKVRNEYIRDNIEVVDIAYKVEKNKLGWLEYVVRVDQVHITDFRWKCKEVD